MSVQTDTQELGRRLAVIVNLKIALQQIAEYDAADAEGYVDEWQQARAFRRCQGIARTALDVEKQS